MTRNITDVSTFTDPALTVSAHDSASADNVLTVLQPLANRTRFLKDELAATLHLINVVNYGGNGDGVTDNTAAFAAASTAAASDSSGIVYIPAGTYKLNSTQSILGNLYFAPGATLKPANAQTIILSGQIQADDHQHIFDISVGGVIAFADTQMQRLNVCHFGADHTGSLDSHDAIRAAIVAAPSGFGTLFGPLCREVYIPPGHYFVNKPIVSQFGGIKIYSDHATGCQIAENGFAGPTVHLSRLICLPVHANQYAGGNTADIAYNGPILFLHRYGPAWLLDGRAAFSLDMIIQINNTQVSTCALLSSSGSAADGANHQAFNIYTYAADQGAPYTNTSLGLRWDLHTTAGSVSATTSTGVLNTGASFYNVRFDYDGAHMRIFINGIAQTLTNADTKITQTGNLVQHYSEGISLGLGLTNSYGGTDFVFIPPLGLRMASMMFKWVSQGSGNYSPPVAKFVEDSDTKFLLNFDVLDPVGGLHFARVYGGTALGMQDAWLPNEDGSDTTKQIPYLIVEGLTLVSNNGPALNANACPNILIKSCFLYGQSGCLFNQNSYNSAIEDCVVIARGDGVQNGGRGFGIQSGAASNYVDIRNNNVGYFDVDVFNSESFSMGGYNYLLSPRYANIYLEGSFAGNIGGSCFISDEGSTFDNPYGLVATGCGVLNIEGILFGIAGHADQLQILIDNSRGTPTPKGHISINAVNFVSDPGAAACIKIAHTRAGDEISIKCCSSFNSSVPLIEIDSTTNGNIDIDSTGTVAVYSTGTIPANLKFGPSAMLKPANAVVATLSGEIEANDYQQIFDLSLGGTFILQLCSRISVCWFGAKGDGVTDDTAAIQALIDLCGSYSPGVSLGDYIYIPKGSYVLSAPIRLNKKGLKFHGEGVGQTLFKRTTTFTGPMFIVSPDYTPNWTLVPGLTSSGGNALKFDSMADGEHRPLLQLRDNTFASLDGLSACTIEFFFKPSASAVGVGGNILQSVGLIRSGGSGASSFQLALADTGSGLYLNGKFKTTGSGTVNIGTVNFVPENVVHHIAVTYDGAHVRWFVGGTLVDTQVATGTVMQEFFENMMPGWSSISFPDGGDTALSPCDGYLDSLRISRNCRYTSTFTAPTTKLTADSNTMMLLNFDGIDHMSVIGQTGNLGFGNQNVYLVLRPNPSLIGTLAIENLDIGNFTIECNQISYPMFLGTAPGITVHDVAVDAAAQGFNIWQNCYESEFRDIDVLLGAVSVASSYKAWGPFGFNFMLSGLCQLNRCSVTSGTCQLSIAFSSVQSETFLGVPNQPTEIVAYIGSDGSISGKDFDTDNEAPGSLSTVILSNRANILKFWGGDLDVASQTSVPIFEFVGGGGQDTDRAVVVGMVLSPSATSSICKFTNLQTSPVDFYGCVQTGPNVNTPYGDSNGNPRVEGATCRTITSGSSGTANDWDQVISINKSGIYNLVTPAHPTVGQPFVVKDEFGDGGTNTKTITANSGQTIDGISTITITVNQGKIALAWNPVTSNWMS